MTALAPKPAARVHLRCVYRAHSLVDQVLHTRFVLINQTPRFQQPQERNPIVRFGKTRLEFWLEALLKRQTQEFAPVIEYVHSVYKLARKEFVDELDWTGKPLRPLGFEQLDRPYLRCITARSGVSENGGG